VAGRYVGAVKFCGARASPAPEGTDRDGPQNFFKECKMTSSKGGENNTGWLLLLGAGALFGFYYFFLRSHPPTAEELSGDWSCTSRPWTLRFASDGKMLMQTTGPVRSGTYQLDAEGLLKVVLTDGKGFQARAEIKNNELTLKDPDGKTSSFKHSPFSLPPPAPSPNAETALQKAQRSLEEKWTYCVDGAGKKSLYTKVVPHAIKPNPFTPRLTPPNAGKEFGFFQFAAPVTHHREQLRPGAADTRNGVRERHAISWFTPSYRTWESRTGRWSAWQTGRGREENNVKFLVSTVTLLADGSWRVEEQYYIAVMGVIVKPVCKDIPAG
jgi:hypothetical protein